VINSDGSVVIERILRRRVVQIFLVLEIQAGDLIPLTHVAILVKGFNRDCAFGYCGAREYSTEDSGPGQEINQIFAAHIFPVKCTSQMANEMPSEERRKTEAFRCFTITLAVLRACLRLLPYS